MNLALLESFGQNYPEENDGTLDTGSMAVTCQFNRLGTLLAVGCNDGRIVVYDFLTRGVAKVYQAHTHTVCSISWSRNGRRFVSAATDNLVCIWDVTSGECLNSYRYPAPVMKVQFAPRDANLVLVCPLKPGPILVRLDTNEQAVLPEIEKGESIVASFDRRGGHIYTGNHKGRVTVIEVNTMKVVASFRVTNGTANLAIREIEFARKGTFFLVSTADRIIRVYDGKEIPLLGLNGEWEPIQKLQDLINRASWRKCCFSGDGEFICAGSAKNHQLIIWERRTGVLVKMLQGLRGEQLLDVVWHPIRPVMCSISSGVVSVWAQNQIENWSAFAPDFTELDENIEYEERESEFDDSDEDKTDDEEEKKSIDDEDVDVDVSTVEPIRVCLSSDEEEEDEDALQFLPITPEIDDPEENIMVPTHDPTYVNCQPDESRIVSVKFDGIEADPTTEHPFDTQTKKNRKRPTSAKLGRPSTAKVAKEGKNRQRARPAAKIYE